MNTTEKNLLDGVASRALHTAWQSGAATAGTLWVGSGLSAADLAHAAGWARLWTVVAVGTGGAVLSAVKTATLNYVAGHRAQIVADAESRIRAELPTIAALIPTAPTVIDDAHPVLADPDAAAPDTATTPAP